jgi:hypothetical protein
MEYSLPVSSCFSLLIWIGECHSDRSEITINDFDWHFLDSWFPTPCPERQIIWRLKRRVLTNHHPRYLNSSFTVLSSRFHFICNWPWFTENCRGNMVFHDSCMPLILSTMKGNQWLTSDRKMIPTIGHTIVESLWIHLALGAISIHDYLTMDQDGLTREMPYAWFVSHHLTGNFSTSSSESDWISSFFGLTIGPVQLSPNNKQWISNFLKLGCLMPGTWFFPKWARIRSSNVSSPKTLYTQQIWASHFVFGAAPISSNHESWTISLAQTKSRECLIVRARLEKERNHPSVSTFRGGEFEALASKPPQRSLF